MRLYAGMSVDFIRDTVRNQVADKLKAAFFNYYRYNPSPAEVNSWRNSLRAMAQVLEYSHLTQHGVLLEYQLPLTSKRLDCLICGKDGTSTDNAVIVELKQWERCEAAAPDKLVRSWVGGRQREIPHPSVQVGQYSQYLADTHTAFYEGPTPVCLSACAYLHNYTPTADDPLLAPKFAETLQRYPVFDADGADALSGYLTGRLSRGEGQGVLDRIEQSRYRPSRKLMDYVAETVRSRSPWILLDEQLVVFEAILSTVKSGVASRKKQVIIVRGGPGTGKSEIGATEYLWEHGKALDCDIAEYELEVQFRCAGSDGFVNWIDNTLGIKRTANVLWDGADGFDFRIVETPVALEKIIREKAEEGHVARVAAGFCWRWSPPRDDGTLVDDVVIGDYHRPWDAKPGNWRLAPGIPPAALWATDPNGINQIGCVYNIQGFELDYVGVIWGKDLVYDLDAQTWVGNKKESADSVVKRGAGRFVDLVKNTYRVLLSRGMKGCYVHFMDKDTERFIRSRMER